MEDIVLSGDLLNVKSDYALSQLKNDNKNSKPGSVKEEIEPGGFLISDNYEKKTTDNRIAMLDAQEAKNIISTAQQGLSSIAEVIDKIEKAKENISEKNIEEASKEIDKQLKNIQNIVENTKFNGKAVLKDEKTAANNDIINSSGIDLKAPEIPEKSEIKTEKDSLAFFKKIEKVREEIITKQLTAQEAENNIIKKVSSTIELNPSLSEFYVEVGNNDFGKIKEETMKEIVKDPEKNVKAQIRHLDKTIIIALMSI
jgi:flagellin-like hook-associated protein FlgL